MTSDNDTRGKNKRRLSFRWNLNELVASIKGICEGLVDIPGWNFGVYETVQRRETRLQKVHLRKRNKVHRDLVHVNIKVTLESH